MTLNELLEKIDLIETTVNVYRDGEKVEINFDSDNDVQIARIYGGKAHEINVDLD